MGYVLPFSISTKWIDVQQEHSCFLKLHMLFQFLTKLLWQTYLENLKNINQQIWHGICVTIFVFILYLDGLFLKNRNYFWELGLHSQKRVIGLVKVTIACWGWPFVESPLCLSRVAKPWKCFSGIFASFTPLFICMYLLIHLPLKSAF